jgi:light-regulated signal transduction histidine kinase (bacteriophytochrome)
MKTAKCPLPEGTTCFYRQHVEQLEEDLEQFMHIVSHDLREPMMCVAGFATILQRRSDKELSKENKHFLEQIIEGTKRLDEKLNDLLAFSRAGRSKPPGSFPLGAAIEEAKRSLARKIAETKATIEVVGDLPVINGDRGLVAQAFQNLFSNSLKYQMPDVPPQIKISAEPYEDGFWKVAVQDNGIGFDMMYKDQIFHVFRRLFTTEQYPGTGIGLAIVEKVIKRHGGAIWPVSAPNAGATFYFTLPSAQQP